MTSDRPTTSTADRELVITRVLDAPRGLVWRAWTDAELGMAWAPEGMSSPSPGRPTTARPSTRRS